MKNLYKIALAFALLFGGAVLAANQQAARAPVSAPGDGPEFAGMGTMAVGTNVVSFDLPNRAKITIGGAITGRLPVETRKLNVRFWYPATLPTGAAPTTYRHSFSSPGKPNFEIVQQGVAIAGAPPLAGQRYPLVLMSHGYRGWADHFSNLAENLASKGYVVASIDHEDPAFDSVTSFQLSFGNVMLDRAQDQRQVLEQILAQSASASTGAASLIDANKVGLIGYSMGGFGALATAGAPYDQASKTIKQLPAGAQRALATPTSDVSSKIKALVTLAPWGGQPDNRSWTAADLAKITAPVLMIAGDQDDIVDYRQGVRWLFDSMTGADRHLLVYQNARHNIASNPVAFTADTDFTTREFFSEPVWRMDRINQINAHFITAFLDATLKGDTSKAAFLNPATPKSNDGVWPTKLGEQLGGKLAGPDQPQHWSGFQRRWAVGLEMHTARTGQAGN